MWLEINNKSKFLINLISIKKIEKVKLIVPSNQVNQLDR